ncbi:hypothetical protein V8G54_031540 [Vigna mungo]|uniref:Dihydropyrimidinase n=1 Tax=Vigna mungo TaxID=3915 RepID=A0AAQ3MJY5_VIGMU
MIPGALSSKLLIKGGTVVNAHHQQVADVYIEDGIIVAIKPAITVGDEVTVIDATGKFVMPGSVDISSGEGTICLASLLASTLKCCVKQYFGLEFGTLCTIGWCSYPRKLEFNAW